MLQNRIEDLKKDLVQYAALVEQMIEKSIKGLVERDHALLTEVIGPDESRANDFEIHIDTLCTNLIAQYEPKARDLRLVLMAMKMGNDLERMGDHAVNIAESGIFLIERPSIKPLVDIPRMAEIVMGMLRNGIDAFVRNENGLARDVCKQDGLVDALRNQILRELITYMSSDPSTIERAMHLLRVASNLERVADLATNISEEVVYLVEGKIIKHHRGEDEKLQDTSI
jgi:phosphate transport system protein